MVRERENGAHEVEIERLRQLYEDRTENLEQQNAAAAEGIRIVRELLDAREKECKELRERFVNEIIQSLDKDKKIAELEKEQRELLKSPEA